MDSTFLKENEHRCLWVPSQNKKHKIDEFRSFVNCRYKLALVNYQDLYKWSVDYYAEFWGLWWEWGNFISSSNAYFVVDQAIPMNQIPKWFPGVRLNFAENLLRFRDNKLALFATGEGQNLPQKLTYSELYENVCRYAKSLSALGIKEGDRVCGYLPNGIVAVEAMLATAAIGAIWSSASPDFGTTGVIERFAQIDPQVLFSVEAVLYNGKIHDHLEKLTAVCIKLNVKKVVIAPFVHTKENISISSISNSIFLDDFLNIGENDNKTFHFVQVPFDHPQFIMFSSGTTGVPKCIVHSVGGTLIQIAKEHILHCDLDREDVMMYYTTTGWMMWNWLVTGLYTGCSLVLYDGSPLIPSVNALWDIVDKIGITILGTGAKWLSVLEQKGVKPIQTNSLKSLRAILSTGSPLSPASFRYVYKDVKKDVLLGSICGGTDIISCFIGGCPTLPVFEGQTQCPLLGMAVEARDADGTIVFDKRGELVCTKPFPSMPIYFWNDHNKIRYFKSYFNQYAGVWTHGDFCIFHSETGGVTILGRSDGTLNPNGVRFGSSEIYNIVDHFVEVQDSLCVSQLHQTTKEERVLLFIKIESDHKFTVELTERIKIEIRKELSARHVPTIILPVEDIPYTFNGKKVEVAVRQVIHGEVVKNKGSLINPQSLDLYTNIYQLSHW